MCFICKAFKDDFFDKNKVGIWLPERSASGILLAHKSNEPTIWKADNLVRYSDTIQLIYLIVC